MHNNKIFFILCAAFLFLLYSCKENKCSSTNYQNNNPITGKIYYENNLIGTQDSFPLPHTMVYVSTTQPGPTFNGNYLLSTTSDSAGNFVFPFVPCNENLYLYASAAVGGITYIGQYAVPLNSPLNCSLKLLPDQDNPGLVVTAIDTMSRLPLIGLKVDLYTNLAAVGDTTKRSASQLTNDHGVVYFQNLLAGNYYLNIRGAMDTTYYDTTIVNFVTVIPSLSQPKQFQVVLTSETVSMTLQVIDSASQSPVPGLNVYLYPDSMHAVNGNGFGATPTNPGLGNGNGSYAFTGLNPTLHYYAGVNAIPQNSTTRVKGVQNIPIPVPANVQMIVKP